MRRPEGAEWRSHAGAVGVSRDARSLSPSHLIKGEIEDLIERLNQEARDWRVGPVVIEAATTLLSLHRKVEELESDRDCQKGNADDLYVRLQSSQSREAALVAALETAQTAINDWLHVYADDMCRDEDVQSAKARIRAQGGTIGYIATVTEQIRSVLSATKETALLSNQANGVGEANRSFAHDKSNDFPK